MRSIKMFLFCFSFIIIICLIFILSINININGTAFPIDYDDFKPLLPVLIMIPLSYIIWGRYVKRSFDINNFNERNWSRTLESYNACEISNNNIKKVYKIPFTKFMFPTEIIVETLESKVVITAPQRIFYDYKKG